MSDPQQMTPQQALNVLSQAARQLSATYAVHAQLDAAATVLQQAIAEPIVDPPDEPVGESEPIVETVPIESDDAIWPGVTTPDKALPVPPPAPTTAKSSSAKAKSKRRRR